MSSYRRWFWIGLVAALAACDTGGPPGLGPDVRRGLDEGRDAATRWIFEARSGDLPSDPTVVALGYLERLRLGLGSPFRLAEQALVDPRLAEPLRREIAWAILARTLDGEAYAIDEAALDRAAPLTAGGVWAGGGGLHLELIESAVTEAVDARGGELAVRLAYALAAAEGTADERGPELAARAAALIRDRTLARGDVLELLRSAQAQARDPLPMIRQWRADRRFAVEAPALAALPPAVELQALELAPRLARGVRDLELRVAAGANRRSRPNTPLLSGPVARRLAELADSLDMPPQAPVAVAVATHRRDLTTGGTLDDLALASRERLIATSVSEERFAAEHARVHHEAPGVAPAVAALSVAVAMRAYAQEPVWFTGMGGPSTRELQERYGLADVRFGDDVAPEWRPYYRRMIDLAIVDLRRVLPALDVRGLVVSIDGQQGRLTGTTLALHDPRTRRMILPPASAAGTIAHEIAHDLDWQVALRRYRVRGDYASDRAARAPRDRLAVRLHELSVASLDPETEGRTSSHARRPAEIFARSIDWFVAVSLAAEGRSNGYLTSVQDDLLTGYGTARAPDITGTVGEALVTILDEVAPLYPTTREWFLKSYGLNRALTPYDLARRVLQAPDGRVESGKLEGPLSPVTVAAMRLGPVQEARAAGFAAIDAWLCRTPGAAYNPRLESARRALVVEAAAARARGTALAYARTVGGEAGRRSVARALYGPAWPDAPIDSATQAVVAPLPAIVSAVVATTIDGVETVGEPPRIDLFAPPGRCAGAPFRASASALDGMD